MKRRQFLLDSSLFASAVVLSPILAGSRHAYAHGWKKRLHWDFLQPGDTIDVVATSSPPTNPERTFIEVREYFKKTDFKVNIPDGLIAPTPLLEAANTSEKRVAFIEKALHSPSKVIWDILGRGWGTDLMPLLLKIKKPKKVKPFIGYSDATALHIFLNQVWGWPSLHCVVLGANGDIGTGAWNKTHIDETLKILTGRQGWLNYMVEPLNDLASSSAVHKNLRIVGGNSLLVSALNGAADLTLDTRGAILFIETIALSPGELSRVLDGYLLSRIVRKSRAVLFGDFVEKGGKNNLPLIEQQFQFIAKRFATCAHGMGIPVMKANNLFGHGEVNLPLPFNTETILHLGKKVRLQVSTR